MENPCWGRESSYNKAMEKAGNHFPIVMVYLCSLAVGKFQQFISFTIYADILTRFRILRKLVVITLDNLPYEKKSAESICCRVRIPARFSLIEEPSPGTPF